MGIIGSHLDITSDGQGHQGEPSAADWGFQRAVGTAILELRNVRAGVVRECAPS